MSLSGLEHFIPGLHICTIGPKITSLWPELNLRGGDNQGLVHCDF